MGDSGYMLPLPREVQIAEALQPIIKFRRSNYLNTMHQRILLSAESCHPRGEGDPPIPQID
jgi:hypothetical protein